ncbi:hypothetical protein R83H12_02545 [Fibrobacteria bacterium R8-3-H12]
MIKVLEPLIGEIRDSYYAIEVYSSNSKHKPTKTEYWNIVIALIDNSERHLLSKLGKECRNMDRHKQAGLLLVALLKKPLFVVNYGQKDSSVGYYSASIVFAWKSALALLVNYIQEDSLPEGYADFLRNNVVSMPSANYETETLRTMELCFRSFHFEDAWHSVPAPFCELDGGALASDKDWAWTLVFANIFSLIESNSLARFHFPRFGL